jgi:hypothetical protein
MTPADCTAVLGSWQNFEEGKSLCTHCWRAEIHFDLCEQSALRVMTDCLCQLDQTAIRCTRDRCSPGVQQMQCDEREMHSSCPC